MDRLRSTSECLPYRRSPTLAVTSWKVNNLIFYLPSSSPISSLRCRMSKPLLWADLAQAGPAFQTAHQTLICMFTLEAPFHSRPATPSSRKPGAPQNPVSTSTTGGRRRMAKRAYRYRDRHRLLRRTLDGRSKSLALLESIEPALAIQLVFGTLSVTPSYFLTRTLGSQGSSSDVWLNIPKFCARTSLL